VARLNAQNVEQARAIIKRYPRSRSALIPLLHLAQEQDGWVTPEAMEHIGELLDLTPAEVLGTCSFYEMFKREPVGKYVVNVCTNISCQLLGGEELLGHCEQALGIKAGSTTPDGLVTLEEVECIAACTEAPALQVNYRYFHKVSQDRAEELLRDLRAGLLDSEIPPHGTTTRVRQSIPVDRWCGRGAEGLPEEVR
jgi:NADH-quinone oxidoreductase subunit E